MASVRQQTYRKLMKVQKAKTAGQKISHPLARYNSVGQLSCLVCTVPVKSEVLWTTHLQSRRHKEAVAALKSQRSSMESELTKPSIPPPAKRKPPDDPESAPTSKRSKVKDGSGLPSGFFDQGVKKLPGIGDADSSDSEEEEEEEEEEGVNSRTVETKPTPTSSLPTDFFDKPQGRKADPGKQQNPKKSDNEQSPGSRKNSELKETLPEGFFDDPKLDAKVRKVEYKDPMVEEWERFQKSIQKEDDVSEALLIEKDEEAKEEREVVEVNEQVSCYNRAETLRLKQEQRMRTQSVSERPREAALEQEGEEGSSSDELEFEEFLDWRAKVS